MSCSAASITCYWVDAGLIKGLVSSFANAALLCILGSRMFLNLKEAAEHDVNVGTNWASHSIGAIGFEEPLFRKER